MENVRRVRSGRFASRTETELEATLERFAEAKASGASVRDAARAMRSTRLPRLTAEQRREVRSLVEDSGYTREEAVAWVLEMGGA